MRGDSQSTRRSSRTIAAIGVLTAVLVSFGIGVVGAAEDVSTLTACAGSNGQLRLVDATDDCRENETVAQWNIVGPRGLPGPRGEQGPKGDPGVAGSDGLAGTDVAGRSCPDGEFLTGFDDDGALLCSTSDGTTEPGGDPDDPGDGGSTDADHDGFTADEDCDDTNADIRPGAEEVYNNQDDDCDGRADEDFESYGSSVGVCQPGVRHTGTGAIVVAEIGPQPEVFDGLDNDCDGITDEGTPQP